jgi:protein-L-isoaspartate(D-aspartate) O-methyltransferase
MEFEMIASQDLEETRESAEARAALLRQLAASGLISDQAVLDALLKVRRHEFVPAGTAITLAYRDCPLSIGRHQTISQPLIVALMTQALSLSGRERVLEIGTGSGYQSAVLSLLAHHVDSIELIPELAREARSRLTRLGYRNVDVHIGDGYQGFSEGAPFDRIILTAAPPEIPDAVLAQLQVGGILVAPVGLVQESGAQGLGAGADADEQRLVRWRKLAGEIVREDLGAVRFVPMVSSSDNGLAHLLRTAADR